MIRWAVTLSFDLEFAVEVSLNVSDGNTPGALTFSGNAEQVDEVKRQFEYTSGAFGHLIQSADEPITAFDADAVLRQGYDVEVIEGAEVFKNGYDSGLGEGRLT